MNKPILIVDDEPHVRLSYRITLETAGLEVREANGAAAALAELAVSEFSLVILDMRMPEMDGLDLLEKIRLNRNHEAAQQNMRRIYELFQFGSSKEPFNLGDE